MEVENLSREAGEVQKGLVWQIECFNTTVSGMVTGTQSRDSLLDGQFVVDGMSALGRPCGADGSVDLRLA